jgi:mono/diheme cytochrome c family protein
MDTKPPPPSIEQGFWLAKALISNARNRKMTQSVSSRWINYIAALLIASAVCAPAQPRPGEKGRIVASSTAIRDSKEDPAAVERGGRIFTAQCGRCHGNSAKGMDSGPNLIYSLLVLRDEKGDLIAPALRTGRPDAGMPKPDLTEAQISDIVAWLHAQTYAADHRTTYAWLDVVTGDPRAGENYFNTSGKCRGCHSVTGDLARVGNKYDPFTLQTRWVNPSSAPGAASERAAVKVRVTLASGQVFAGRLERISDFEVALRDSSGEYRSFTRDGATPKVEIEDPLKAHKEMLHQYTDADIHNVTAYLATLK